MQPREETVEENGTGRKSERAAVYVDEPKTLEGRREELTDILRYAAKTKPRMESIIIYGSPTTDADDRINKIIARLEKNGTKVTFDVQSRTPPEGT